MSQTSPLTQPAAAVPSTVSTAALPPAHAKASGKAGEEFQRLLEAPSSARPVHEHAASPALASPLAKEPQVPPDAPSIEGEHPPASGGRAAETDSGSGAQVRHQQLWAQAQRETASDKTAALPLNTQAFDGAALQTPRADATPDAVATPRGGGNDFVALLLDQCAQMYVAQGADPNNARMLLDLGHTLPGSLVELARDGAFLRVRLHAADAQAGRLMEAQRERLVASLERSTRLGVVVDVVRAG